MDLNDQEVDGLISLLVKCSNLLNIKSKMEPGKTLNVDSVDSRDGAINDDERPPSMELPPVQTPSDVMLRTVTESDFYTFGHQLPDDLKSNYNDDLLKCWMTSDPVMCATELMRKYKDILTKKNNVDMLENSFYCKMVQAFIYILQAFAAESGLPSVSVKYDSEFATSYIIYLNIFRYLCQQKMAKNIKFCKNTIKTLNNVTFSFIVDSFHC